MCVYVFFFRTYLSDLISVQWWCKNLVLRLISAIDLSLSLVSFVLALNFSAILNVQVLSSVCT